MEATLKVPVSQRINIRLIVLAAVVMLPMAWMVYVFVHERMTGGIEDVGGGLTKVDLKAMSLFDFPQAHGTMSDIPSQWRNMNGKHVVVYGEQWAPLVANDKVAGFQLCYSIAKCCFNGPPQVQHFVDCTVSHDALAGYYGGDLVKVVGTLHVNVKQGAEKVNSIYQMDVESVEEQ